MLYTLSISDHFCVLLQDCLIISVMSTLIIPNVIIRDGNAGRNGTRKRG